MQVRDNRHSTPELSPGSGTRPVFEMHAEMCQALANQHRLAMMHTLKDGERCVSDLAAEIGISVHNVSQHLRILKQRLLVRSRKEGQTVYYSVTNPKFVQACSLIREALIEEYRAAGQSLGAAAALDSEEKPGEDSGGTS